MRIIDSHTGGEPTRTIVSGGPMLGNGSMAERRTIMASQFDHIRTTLIDEPRGSAVMVGALLCDPVDPNNTAGVIFFNNSGYLGMCGHGTIGLIVTLFHMGKVSLGLHRIETPVGVVEVELLSPHNARLDNVPSYRYAQGVELNVPYIGKVTGDIAWGGNWFFLIKDHGQCLTYDNCPQLLNYTSCIQQSLISNNITGANGEIVDHVELFGEPTDTTVADSQNFVLCPGREYDRSPCGTGTSAKMACLFQDGLLKPGQLWRQQSIIGSIFEGSIKLVNEKIIPSICGEAFVSMDATIIQDDADPFKFGLSRMV